MNFLRSLSSSKLHVRNAFKILAFSILILNFFACNSQNHIYQGVLDWSDAAVYDQKVIDLEGTWKIYPGIDHPDTIDQSNYELIEAPGNWSLGDNVKQYGHAVYHIRVRNSPTTNLALYLGPVNMAYKVWVGQNLVTQVGMPTTGPDNFKADYQTQVIPFYSEQKDLDVFIFVSNYVHRRGGLFGRVFLGHQTDITQLREQRLTKEAVLIAVIVLISLYALLIFYIDPRQKNYLYFALFCLSAVMRLAVTGEMLLNIVWPHIPPGLFSILKYNGFILSAGFIALYQDSIFGSDFSKKAAYIFGGISALAALLIILTPVWLNSYISQGFQVATIGGIVVVYYQFARIVRKADFLTIMLLIGFSLIVISFIHDAVVAATLIPYDYWQIYGYAIYSVIQAIYFGIRYRALHRKINLLYKQLQEFGAITKKKTEFEQEIIRDLENMSAKVSEAESQEYLAGVISKLNLKPTMSVKHQVTLQHLERLNDEFTFNLKKNHPSLTAIEIELCICLKAQLSNKEIAQLREITPESVKKSKTRLRKKLRIPRDVTIYNFLDRY